MPQQLITGILVGTTTIDGRQVDFSFTVEARSPHVPIDGSYDYGARLNADRALLNKFYGEAIATIQAAYQVSER